VCGPALDAAVIRYRRSGVLPMISPGMNAGGEENSEYE
jgi:hypothetical protein